MRYGRSVPSGWLPVFSVDTEEEAKELIILTCQTNHLGEYYSRELALDRTLDTLELFSQKLAHAYPIALQLIAERRHASQDHPTPVQQTLRQPTRDIRGNRRGNTKRRRVRS